MASLEVPLWLNFVRIVWTRNRNQFELGLFVAIS